jgi:hypothetical protein
MFEPFNQSRLERSGQLSLSMLLKFGYQIDQLPYQAESVRSQPETTGMVQFLRWQCPSECMTGTSRGITRFAQKEMQ